MPRPAVDAAATRERILEIARQRFVEVGYEKTSLREIAEELGVTKAALYYHFPSKLEILQAMLEPIATIFEEMSALLGAVRESDTPLEAWADTLEWVVRRVMAHRPLFSVVQRNRQVAETAFEDWSEIILDHDDGHTLIDTILLEVDLPVRDRIRMACALGAVTGFDDWAPGLLESLDDETLVVEMVAMTRDLLDLPPKPVGI